MCANPCAVGEDIKTSPELRGYMVERRGGSILVGGGGGWCIHVALSHELGEVEMSSILEAEYMPRDATQTFDIPVRCE